MKAGRTIACRRYATGIEVAYLKARLFTAASNPAIEMAGYLCLALSGHYILKTKSGKPAPMQTCYFSYLPSSTGEGKVVKLLIPP